MYRHMVITGVIVAVISGLHKNFPHISPVVTTSDLEKPSRGPPVLDITCSLQDEKIDTKAVAWRWIKDDVIDIKYSDDYQKGRIEMLKDDHRGRYLSV